MFKFRDPVSGLTHLAGAFLSIIGMTLLIQCSLLYGKDLNAVTFLIFGISLILLYSASSLYHLLNVSEKIVKILRKIDHSMIYVLIAGTYTPVCLIALKGIGGKILFITVWTLAAVGILMKIFWFNAPRWLYTFFYVVMGWIAIFAIYPLFKALPVTGFIWMVAGGIFYTIGAVIYATKWPALNIKFFGFHEIFHLFVLLGSFCHYWLMLKYIMFL